jgi:hypothetical protein
MEPSFGASSLTQLFSLEQPIAQSFLVITIHHPPRMAGVWVSSYCLNTEGFPKILYATLQKLDVQERLEYEGHEYMKHGTERCKITVYISKSEEFPNVTEA